MCNTGDAESPSFSSTSFPKARKEHVCCECGAGIDKGEVYENTSGMRSGGFSVFKTCLFCVDTREMYRGEENLSRHDTVPIGELWECAGMDFRSKKQQDNTCT